MVKPSEVANDFVEAFIGITASSSFYIVCLAVCLLAFVFRRNCVVAVMHGVAFATSLLILVYALVIYVAHGNNASEIPTDYCVAFILVVIWLILIPSFTLAAYIGGWLATKLRRR